MRLFAVLLLLSSCGREARDAPSADPPARPAPTPPTADPGDVHLRATVMPSGEVELRVEQRGEGLVRLAPAVTVERADDGRFTALADAAVRLRPSCDDDAPPCLPLGRGGTLAPPPFTGRTGRGQCTGASEGRALPAGDYRFVLATCDGARIEGPTFTLGR